MGSCHQHRGTRSSNGCSRAAPDAGPIQEPRALAAKIAPTPAPAPAPTVYGQIAVIRNLGKGERKLRIKMGSRIIIWEPDRTDALFTTTSYNHATTVNIVQIVEFGGAIFAVWGQTKNKRRAIRIA